MNQKEWVVFFVTLISTINFAGLLGAFAMIKGVIGETFQVSEGYFGKLISNSGIVDALSFLGRVFGSIYVLLFPSKTLKKDFALNCLYTVAFLSLITLLPLYPSYSKAILAISMLGSGFCRTYLTVPFIMYTENIDVEREKKMFSIWNALFYMGDVLAVLGSYLIMDVFHFKWQYSFCFFLLSFFASTLLFYFALPEITSNRGQEENSSSL